VDGNKTRMRVLSATVTCEKWRLETRAAFSLLLTYHQGTNIDIEQTKSAL